MDCSSFGMQESERAISSGYRYGFGGQEKDDEVKGEGNSYTADFWEYDPRLGRRWNRDPVVKPWESSYAAFANNPIYYNDPNGDDAKDWIRKAWNKVKSFFGGDWGWNSGKVPIKLKEIPVFSERGKGKDQKKPNFWQKIRIKATSIVTSLKSNSCHRGDHSEMGVGKNTKWFSFFITGGEIQEMMKKEVIHLLVQCTIQRQNFSFGLI